MKIVINGGHCPGLDSGAVGSSGLQEAIVARDIMKRTACFLRAVGYEVLEVQENELFQITNASNNYGADLFASIHVMPLLIHRQKGQKHFVISLVGDPKG